MWREQQIGYLHKVRPMTTSCCTTSATEKSGSCLQRQQRKNKSIRNQWTTRCSWDFATRSPESPDHKTSPGIHGEKVKVSIQQHNITTITFQKINQGNIHRRKRRSKFSCAFSKANLPARHFRSLYLIYYVIYYLF